MQGHRRRTDPVHRRLFRRQRRSGVTLDVIGYDETILVPGKLGADSKLTFKKPNAEFYVLFDAGPGHVVEIDQADIEAP